MEERKTRKSRIGLVKSDKMDKTVTVLVERKIKHPIYGKFLTRSKKYMAHNNNNDAHEGDLVRIVETRPLSAKKRWRVAEIIERAK